MNTNNAILLTFFIIFSSMAYAIPLVQDSFNEPVSNYDVEGFSDDTAQVPSFFDVSTYGFIVNMFTILFWTFGAPAWLNLAIFLPIRMIVILILYDKFRGLG